MIAKIVIKRGKGELGENRMEKNDKKTWIQKKIEVRKCKKREMGENRQKKDEKE